MASAKIKVEYRLNQMLSQFRELHRSEKNEDAKEALRELIVKQIDLIEWAAEAFPSRSAPKDR